MEGNTQKEFGFWAKAFEEQLWYIDGLWDRFKRGKIDKTRLFEVLDSALDRLRYIQQQLIWVEQELHTR